MFNLSFAFAQLLWSSGVQKFRSSDSLEFRSSDISLFAPVIPAFLSRRR